MKIKRLIYILIPAILMFGCKKEDFTGMSSVTPTNPTITVTGVQATPYSDIDGVNSFHKFTLTMDVAQVVDVEVWINVTGGTATEDEDFSLPSTVTIPAGRTTASFKVEILKDDADESTEDFTIQIGDDRTANAKLTPVTQKFEIKNFTGDDLALELSWNPVVYDQFGELIDPTDVADMIFNIFDSSGTLIDQSDGSGFEGLVMPSTLPDGTYTIEAEYYDAMTFDDPVDLDIAVSTYQIGVSASTTDNDYPGLTSTADAPLCNLQVFLLTIEKTGTTYNVVSTPQKLIPFALTDFVGNYSGIEYELYGGTMYGGYPSLITSLNATSDTLLVDSLGKQVMMNFWGEIPVIQVPTRIVINSDGTLDIPVQFCMTTDWASDYNISGTGTWNSCDQSMDIQFDLIYTDGSGALSDYADDGVLHAKIDKNKKSYHTTIPLKSTSFKHHH